MRRGYSRVRQLYTDLVAAIGDNPNWSGRVQAQETLGEKASLPLWFLAECFLLTWSRWRDLIGRYEATFGPPEPKLWNDWKHLNQDCEKLALELSARKDFSDVISNVERAFAATMSKADAISLAELPDWTRAIARAHQLSTLGRTLASIAKKPLRDGTVLNATFPLWAIVADRANYGNMRLVAGIHELPEPVRRDVFWHMSRYRESNLLYSWQSTPDAFEQAPRSALELLLGDGAIPVNKWLGGFVEDLKKAGLDPYDDSKHAIARIERTLEWIHQTLATMGFEKLFAAVTDGDFHPTSNSPSGDVNVILRRKRRGTTKPRTVLLALSRGKSGPMRMGAVIPKVCQHLDECRRVTRVVVVICDHWDPRVIEDNLRDLQRHFDDGVRFLFLLAGTPDTNCAQVPVVFNELRPTHGSDSGTAWT